MLEFGLLGIPFVVTLAVLFGLYMAWTIGANDVANAMGTSVGSGALSLRNAIIAAGVLEFAGAVLAGGSVTKTVRSGIVDAEQTFVVRQPVTYNATGSGFQPLEPSGGGVAFSPELYVLGMLAALLGTALWLTLATWKGMPVSTTHSIVGGVLGAGLVAATMGRGWRQAADHVHWDKVTEIAQSWLFAPFLGAAVAFALYLIVQRTILDRADAAQAAVRWRPLWIFLDALIIAMATLLKGLKNVGWYRELGWDQDTQFIVSLLIAAAITGAAEAFLRGRPASDDVEKQFVGLQVVTACSVAFAHGANDVANAIGPLAGIVSTLEHQAFVAEASLAWWILPLGGAGIVIGLATWGYKVMATIGSKIAEMTPSRGFAAELAAAATIILATVREIPVSTSQILVGAVMGVGLALGVRAIDRKVLLEIAASWLLTLPVAAVLAGSLMWLLALVGT